MTIVLPALLALGYCATVLFALAGAFRKLYGPRRAALTAWALSAIVHGATALFADPERWLPLTLFWLGPHLLLLPALLFAASRQEVTDQRARRSP